MDASQRRGHIPTHPERYREVATVLGEESMGWLVGEAAASRLVRRRDGEAKATPAVHARHAAERLGVTFIKAGQALSTRTDIIPPDIAAELGRLQDDVPAEPFETMKRVLEDELQQPLVDAFATFDRVPIGAASIGQVYRATLADGSVVAVKVQRPGVRELADVDLAIGLRLVRRARSRFSERLDLDLEGLAEQFAEALRGEFDYVREATSIERLRGAFDGDDTVVFPRVHWTHTTPRVLTLDLLEGVRMNDTDALDAAGCDRTLLALRGINAYLHMIFDVGLFHADPHPGNFIAMPGDRVGLTDFGRVGELSVESREHFIELLDAVVDRDDEAATGTLLSLSSSKDVDEAALEKDVARLIGKYRGRELGGIDAGDLFGDVLSLFRTHRLGIPNDFGVLLATLAVLEGVGTRLDPGFDFTRSVAPFVERAMRDRMRPGAIADRLGQDLRRGGRILERLPTSVDRILRRAETGQFGIQVTPRGYEKPLERVSELINRLAFAIVIAAVIIGSTRMLSETPLPGWLVLAGQVSLIAALLVAFWFFGSIIASHHRASRKR